MTQPEMPQRRRLFWLLQLGGWGTFGLAMLAIGVTEWPLEYALVRKAALTGFGFLASLFLWRCYHLLPALRFPRLVVLASAVPLSYLASLGWMTAHNFIVTWYVGQQRDLPDLAWTTFPDITNTIYYSFLLGAWSALYFGGQAYLDLVDQRERSIRAEALLHQVRLQALRLQLNPHFLFNTLNGISTLIAEGDGRAANGMLSRLSQFLRSTLNRPDQVQVPLADEIDLIRQYLEIERIRLGDRLTVDIQVTGEAGRVPVPPLILQPLVENALRHGIMQRESGGTIRIIGGCSRGVLHLSVRNDGSERPRQGDPPEGIGLANVRARLLELHGTAGALSLAELDTGEMEASVRIPAGCS
jgi:two-component system, LytTR family, sensor kinase